jgi:succinate dehydrogenase / fumarate reductase, cytochrome b subunit
MSEPRAGGPARSLAIAALRPTGVRRLVFWLEPRWRDPGWLAFALNRLSGVILIFYLVAHLFLLSRLLDGPQGWDSLLSILGSRPFLIADTLLIAAVTYHGLNGLRLALLAFGIGTQRTGALFATALAASTAITLLAGWAILR